MAIASFSRLEHIQVEKLFGYYDHDVSLRLEDRITILHGPNGVGKTSLLRIVNALLSGDLGYFCNVPFERITLSFVNNAVLTLETIGISESNEKLHRLSLESSPQGQDQYTEVNLGNYGAKYVADRLDFLRLYRAEPEVWLDIRDDELLTGAQVIRRYGEHSGSVDPHEDEKLQWLHEFLGTINAHFIREQRLTLDRSTISPRRYYEQDQSSAFSSVVECARHFKRRLDNTMAEYGRNAQKLDQTFPQRVISAKGHYSPQKLRLEMAELNDKTDALKDLGLLDVSLMTAFDGSELDASNDDTQMIVMTLYVQDSEEKLKPLEELAKRTSVFFDIINEKFRRKRVRIDSRRGFVVEGKTGEVPLPSLSSGEQHEIVLHYDLLFRLKRNTVVLIDEPELSLHVEWQKRFLKDLQDTAALSEFDAIVATHSPYIVNERYELMTELNDRN